MLELVRKEADLWKLVSKISQSKESYQFEGESPNFLFAYGPVAQKNQFQEMLYCKSFENGFNLLPIVDLTLMGKIPWYSNVICHFHWLHDWTKVATSKQEANRAVDSWKSLINHIKDNGHHIIWTVHNIMPHDTMWSEQDLKIHQLMANSADIIHIMAEDTVALVAPYYKLVTHKVMYIPHPSYIGAQPSFYTKKMAKSYLNISDNDFVFFSFGAIMPYKGYDNLMKAFDALQNEITCPVRLLIAGMASDKKQADELKIWASNRNNIDLHLKSIHQNELQIYFKASDYVLCPYNATLNSGVAMMASSFGIPIIAPNVGGFGQFALLENNLDIKQNDWKSLLMRMKMVINSNTNHEKYFYNIAKKCLPYKISNSFFKKTRRNINDI